MTDTRFKKGVRPKHTFPLGNKFGKGGSVPKHVREIRKVNTLTLEKIINENINLPLEELKTKLGDPTTPVLELMLLRIIAEAFKSGDERKLDFLLNRLVGKVTEKIEHHIPRPTIVRLRNGDSLVMGTELDKFNQQKNADQTMNIITNSIRKVTEEDKDE